MKYKQETKFRETQNVLTHTRTCTYRRSSQAHVRTIVRWLRQIFLISKRQDGGISGNLHTTVRIQSAVASQVGQQSFNNTVKNNRKTIKPKSRRRKGNRDDTAAMLISRPTRLVAAVQSTHDRCATSWRGTPSPQRYRLARSRIDRFSYSCTVLDSHPSMLSSLDSGESPYCHGTSLSQICAGQMPRKLPLPRIHPRRVFKN